MAVLVAKFGDSVKILPNPHFRDVSTGSFDRPQATFLPLKPDTDASKRTCKT
jgi:hypothetical protein